MDKCPPELGVLEHVFFYNSLHARSLCYWFQFRLCAHWAACALGCDCMYMLDMLIARVLHRHSRHQYVGPKDWEGLAIPGGTAS